MTRYKAESWTKIVVGELNSLLAQTNAWSAASKSGIEVGDSPIQSQAEVIIVDSNGKNVANTVKQMLPMLAKGGVLFTVEPLVPAGDVDENDEAGMAVVEGFNSWINLIQSTNETHYIAFNPLFGGTLVAFPRCRPAPKLSKRAALANRRCGYPHFGGLEEALRAVCTKA